MRLNTKNRFDPYTLAALLVACVAAWFLISGGGLLNTRGGGDSPFLLQRLHQLERALWDGHFPVRWMPDANYGYGYPFFNFYAPLSFYVPFFYRLFGFSYVQAIQLSQLTAFLVAAWGSYRLALRWFDHRPAALLSSAAYTLAPFHLVNVYVRGDSIAEFWAMAFYPLSFLALERLLDRVKAAESGRPDQAGRRVVVWLAPAMPLGWAYAGLILSHNISALIFSPFLGLYTLLRLTQSGRSLFWRGLVASVGALLFGLALSAWFWLPAIGEQGLTQLSEITVGYFNHRYNDGYHFRSANLIQPTFFYNPDVAGGNAFRMGLVQAALILGGLIVAAVKRFWGPRSGARSGSPVNMLLIGGFLLATFMLSPYSIGLWDRLPLLPFAQFPWRFLSIQAFFGAGLTGLWLAPARAGSADRSDDSSRWGIGGAVALCLLLLVANLGRLQPDYLPVSDGDVTAERLARYEWFTRNIGTTISAEYLAPSMTPRPVTSAWLEDGRRDRVAVLSGTAAVELIARKTGFEAWSIQVDSAGANLILPTMYWPGWGATLANGAPLEIGPAPNSGLIQITLPSGDHLVELKLQPTPIRRWGEWLSLAAVLLGLGWLGLGLWQRALVFDPIWLLIPAVGIAGLLLGRLWGQTLPDDQLLNWDFGEMGYLHRADAIVYGHGATLNGYRYSADVVGRCDRLEIELDWSNPPEGDIRQVALSLVTPSDNFFSDVPPVLSQSQPLTAGVARYAFDLPADMPTGLVLPHLALSDRNRPRTETGDKRGFLYLRPIRIEPGCQADVTAGRDLSAGLAVRPTQIGQSPSNPSVLDVGLAWSTEALLAENLAVSIRLTDQIGREIHAAQRDTQPGFGYRPSSLWPVEAPVYDRLNLHLPAEMPFEPPYLLLVRLYAPDSGQTRLNRRLGSLDGRLDQLQFTPHSPSFELPAGAVEPVNVVLQDGDGPLIQLLGYGIDQQADKIDLTLYWQALAAPSIDYSHFVHLLDPATGLPIAQHDAQPQNDTYPTSQWVPDEVVADRLSLLLPDLPPGSYPLSVGLYLNDSDTSPRLQRADGGGNSIHVSFVKIE